jgi:uncharacterized membrane protein
MMAWLIQAQNALSLTAQAAEVVTEMPQGETLEMSWLHHIEEVFWAIAQVGQVILEGVAVVCVLVGIILTAQLALKLMRRRQRTDFPFLQVRLKFGLWLALALEFQLGADILNTTIAPSTDALIRLAVIAVIRTFLNYFLNKEIEAQLEMREKAMTHSYHNLFADEPPEDKPHA